MLYKTSCQDTVTLQWRYNGRDSVSNHQPSDCLLNHLFKRRSTKTSKLRVTGLCAWNSPVTGDFPAQMASNAETVFIWWRHHDTMIEPKRWCPSSCSNLRVYVNKQLILVYILRPDHACVIRPQYINQNKLWIRSSSALETVDWQFRTLWAIDYLHSVKCTLITNTLSDFHWQHTFFIMSSAKICPSFWS